MQVKISILTSFNKSFNTSIKVKYAILDFKITCNFITTMENCDDKTAMI